MRRATCEVVVAIATLIVAGCGASSPTSWAGVQRVRITVSQPSLPPPGGRPSTTILSSPLQVTRARAALIAYGIHHTSSSGDDPGCTGGIQINIAVRRLHQPPLRLNAYRCGGRTTGTVGGNLIEFLSAVGVSVP